MELRVLDRPHPDPRQLPAESTESRQNKRQPDDPGRIAARQLDNSADRGRPDYRNRHAQV